jgi:hypothetical protein
MQIPPRSNVPARIVEQEKRIDMSFTAKNMLTFEEARGHSRISMETANGSVRLRRFSDLDEK